MFTTGPFALASGQSITELDPCIPRQNAAVQLQNLSGFLLTVQIGASQIPIPPFSAVTMSQSGGYQIEITTTQTANTQTGSLVLVWLQPGEASPTVDGPLTTALAQVNNMSWTPGGYVPYTSPITVGPASLYSNSASILVSVEAVSVPPSSVYFTITGALSNKVYYTSPSYIPTIYPQVAATFNFSTSDDTSFVVTLYSGTNTVNKIEVLAASCQ
jgi:hypothetical protein